MRLFATLAAIFLLYSPAVPKDQQKQADEQHAINQNPPNASPVTVIVNQPPASEKAKDSNYQAAKVQPQANQKWYEWSIPAALSFLANLALVAVAIWGVNVAADSLEEVRRQAVATEDAATAAKNSAQAVINAERAWVMADLDFSPGFGLTKVTRDGIEHTVAKVELRIYNCGPTPAWVFEQWIRLRVDNFVVASATEYPVPQFPEIADQGNRATLRTTVGNYSILPMVNGQDQIKWTADVSDEGWATPDNGLYVHIFGIVRYRDAFSHLRETYFGYGIFKGELERMPSEAYNKNT